MSKLARRLSSSLQKSINTGSVFCQNSIKAKMKRIFQIWQFPHQFGWRDLNWFRKFKGWIKVRVLILLRVNFSLVLKHFRPRKDYYIYRNSRLQSCNFLLCMGNRAQIFHAELCCVCSSSILFAVVLQLEGHPYVVLKGTRTWWSGTLLRLVVYMLATP